MRSKAAIACVTSLIVMASPTFPKTSLKALAYSGSRRTILRMGSWFGRFISTGLRNGWVAWRSRLGSRPSQNRLVKYAALTTVGALRVPLSFFIPSETLRPSVNVFSFTWQLLQLTSPVLLKRFS